MMRSPLQLLRRVFARAESPVRRPLSADAAAAIAAAGTERGVKYYQFSFVDLFGVQRSKLVPASAVEGMAKDGAGFAGFACHLDMTPADGDLLAVPDPDSLTVLPWRPDVAWLACDLWLGGAPVAQSPRGTLQRCLDRLEEKGGVALKTGVECEFFLLDADVSAGPKVGDGLDTQRKPCYDAHCLMRRADLIAELLDHMEALGWGPYQADHEDANGQFEINWSYDTALRTADRQVFFKYMVRSLAEARGLRASFMPKPVAALTGNGCHAHLSLHDPSTGANVCGGGDGATRGLSAVAVSFLGGILRHAPACAALLNPTVNSYKRLHASSSDNLSGATWAPSRISWGGNNRTVMVRVPDAPRMELRAADMSANPYLLPAAAAAAGLRGIEQSLTPPVAPTDLNLYSADNAELVQQLPQLPRTLGAALDELEADAALYDALGGEFVEAYLKLRRAHWDEYLMHLSEWEVEQYLDC